MQKVIDGVRVTYTDDISDQEAAVYANQEIAEWKGQHKQIDYMMIKIDGNEVVIEAHERSPIRRIRRITGYLSEVSNFNDGKRAELIDRTNQDNQEYNYPSDRERYLERQALLGD